MLPGQPTPPPPMPEFPASGVLALYRNEWYEVPNRMIVLERTEGTAWEPGEILKYKTRPEYKAGVYRRYVNGVLSNKITEINPKHLVFYHKHLHEKD